MICPFCKKELKTDPFGSMDASYYHCDCKENLEFTNNWRRPDSILAEWYTTFLGFKIRHSTSISRELFQE